MALAAKMKESRSTIISDQARERYRTNTRQAEKPDESIKSNNLYKILFEGEATPVQRKEVVAKFMSATLDKAQDEARNKEYEEFREWLAHQNTALAQEIIELTNTKTFALLQGIIDKMNGGIIEINEKMDPLTDIIESINFLNVEDKMYDVYSEIDKENELKEKREAELAEIQAKIDAAKESNIRLDSDSRALAQKRGLFGFGGVPQDAREQIARNEATMAQNEAEQARLVAEMETLKNAPVNPESALSDDMIIHKDRLREFLNLSEGRTVEQMEELVQVTLKFVEDSKASTMKIREEFGDLDKRLSFAEDKNQKFTTVFGILQEGLKGAAKNNIDKGSELAAELEKVGDDVLAKMDLDNNVRNLNNHSKMLGESQKETATTFANLTKQTIRVNTMRESTTQQINLARNLNTEGVSTTTNQLASVITAISGAAVTESASVVENSLRIMSDKSDLIMQKEVIRNATNIEKSSRKLAEIAEGLSGFRDTQRIATEIVGDGLKTITENMNIISQERDALAKEFEETIALSTENAYVGEDAQPAAQKESVSNNSGSNFDVKF